MVVTSQRHVITREDTRGPSQDRMMTGPLSVVMSESLPALLNPLTLSSENSRSALVSNACIAEGVHSGRTDVALNCTYPGAGGEGCC